MMARRTLPNSRTGGEDPPVQTLSGARRCRETQDRLRTGEAPSLSANGHPGSSALQTRVGGGLHTGSTERLRTVGTARSVGQVSPREKPPRPVV